MNNMNMKMKMNNIIYAVIMSFIIGSLYYHIMESSIPLESNCSFIASPWTDILAFIAGLFIIYKANYYNDTMLAVIGGSIITEHIWQCFPKYTFFTTTTFK